jgi:hypothetical protein
VQKCLDLLANNSMSLQRSLAPVSNWNRQTVTDWLDARTLASDWSVLSSDWFNLLDLPLKQPVSHPADRRGRLSRPGPEKFPTHDTMALCFPKTALSNVILGADSLMQRDTVPDHWTLYPFGSLTPAQFFNRIDFMVYYTAPTWRESFGRVIAEAIAAGKIVITDPETAKPFKGGAIGARPDDVDDMIARYVAKPETYQADVKAAQKQLSEFSGAAFSKMFKTLSDQLVRRCA